MLYTSVCVCVCSCAYHLLCHLSNWTDCLASQHQMVPAVVRHCRIQPYISYNNAYTHTHTCIHTSRLISETDQRFTSFHTKKTSGRCRFTLTSTFFHTCVLICEESVRSHTVRVKRSELQLFMWVDLPQDCSVLQRPCLPACRYRSLLQPYLASALPVVALAALVMVWEASGENVCDPPSVP